jgi:hypothetical protein
MTAKFQICLASLTEPITPSKAGGFTGNRKRRRLQCKVDGSKANADKSNPGLALLYLTVPGVRAR